MQATVTVEAKTLGRRAPLFADWSLPLASLVPDPAATFTLRALIARVVLAEIDAFQQRQDERRLVQVLTRSEIEQGLAAGKVDMGGHDRKQAVDPQAAVAAALQAFEDRLYMVFVDGQQQPDLEAALHLEPGSRISFVRLVALAGG